jgi:sn-glycerol 3-phosphate transport system permease protein
MLPRSLETSKCRVVIMRNKTAENFSAAPVRRRKKILFLEGIEPFLYLIPLFAVFGIFLYYPMVRTILMSLSIVNSMGVIVDFAGLENYIELITDTTSFWPSLFLTLRFTLMVVPAQIVVGVFLGLLAENRAKKTSPLRVIYALPMAVSSACASVIWVMLFNPATGLIHYFFHIRFNWLGDGNLALIMIAITTVWLTMGTNFLYAYSGLQGIPAELYESAAIEGANFFKTLWHITLPSMSPTLFFLLVTNTIGAFQTFTLVNVMTGGGPGTSTRVLAYNIYREAFGNTRWGYACAQSMVFMLILLTISLIQFHFEKRGVHYQ